MKINKAISLCKKSGIVCIYDTPAGLQWISNREAAFPMMNMPEFTPEMLCYAHDITEKQQEKLLFVHTELPDALSFEDCVPGEEQAEEYGLIIHTNSKTVIPLRTTKGTFFIDESLLAPISDTPDVFFWLRISKSGKPYFAAKRGFEIVGVICPVVGIVNETFTDSLRELYEECRIMMLNQRESTQ